VGCEKRQGKGGTGFYQKEGEGAPGGAVKKRNNKNSGSAHITWKTISPAEHSRKKEKKIRNSVFRGFFPKPKIQRSLQER